MDSVELNLGRVSRKTLKQNLVLNLDKRIMNFTVSRSKEK